MMLLAFLLLLPLLGGLLEPLVRCRGYIATATNFLIALLLTTWLVQHKVNLQVTYGKLLSYTLTLSVTSLTLKLAVISSWIISLISLYSIGYMWHDYRRCWYWFFQNLAHVATLFLLFAGDLLTLVISVNMLELCSYALIGHWYRDEPERYVGEGFSIWKFRHLWAPSTAALRAIVVTSIGASALILLTACELSRGTLLISEIGKFSLPEALLLLLAVSVYSPLVPFSEWLFTAMAGPVPVSALIHSVTLVNAGAYILLKLGHAVPSSLLRAYMIYILVSCLLMGICGIASREVKVILASSTIIYVGALLYFSSAYILVPELSKIAELGMILVLAAHGFSKAALFTSCGYLMHISGTRFVDDISVFIRYRQGYSALALAAINLFGVVPSTGMLLKEILVHVSERDAIQLALVILLALTSIVLLMKILLYFRECRKRARVVEHIELHEKLMEYASATLAIAPYALAPFFFVQVFTSSLNMLLFITTYIAAVTSIALCVAVFAKGLHKKVPELVLKTLKARLGLPVLVDIAIAEGYVLFAQYLHRASSLLDRLLHSTLLFNAYSRTLARIDRELDRLIHVSLPRAIRGLASKSALAQVSRLLTGNVLVTALILTVLLAVLCVCCLMF